jgi:hypothetical protein
LRVLFATSEAHPLIKTGGLADVSGALPKALTQVAGGDNVDIKIIIPGYKTVLAKVHHAEAIATIGVFGYTCKIILGKMPDSSLKLLQYIPRAIQIALFAPFPNTWLGDFKLTKLVASIEMLVFYAALVGIVFLFKKENKHEVYFILLFSIVFLTIYGLTISNIGTLYRLRFCYEFLLVLIGLSGWSSIFKVKEVNLINESK